MNLVGIGPPLVNVGVTTVRQIYTPEHLLGRVTAGLEPSGGEPCLSETSSVA